jgi:hypothetical protein
MDLGGRHGNIQPGRRVAATRDADPFGVGDPSEDPIRQAER